MNKVTLGVPEPALPGISMGTFFVVEDGVESSLEGVSCVDTVDVMLSTEMSPKAEKDRCLTKHQ